MRPVISVVMPIYNSSGTLANAVSSIICQTYQNWELIIVNDGSDDRQAIYQVCARFNDPRIKIFDIPHQGMLRARIFGNTKALGEYIALQDADDMALPDRLERAINALKKTGADVYVSALYVNMWNEHSQAMARIYRNFGLLKKDEKKQEEKLLTQQVIPGAVIFKKTNLKKKPFRLETEHAWDWMLHLDWTFSDFNYVFDDVATYEYVRRKNSLSEINERDGKRNEALLKIEKIMKKEYNVDFIPLDFDL